MWINLKGVKTSASFLDYPTYLIHISMQYCTNISSDTKCVISPLLPITANSFTPKTRPAIFFKMTVSPYTQSVTSGRFWSLDAALSLVTIRVKVPIQASPLQRQKSGEQVWWMLPSSLYSCTEESGIDILPGPALALTRGFLPQQNPCMTWWLSPGQWRIWQRIRQHHLSWSEKLSLGLSHQVFSCGYLKKIVWVIDRNNVMFQLFRRRKWSFARSQDPAYLTICLHEYSNF